MSEAHDGRWRSAGGRRAALLVAALLLLAGWFGWSGYAQWRAGAVAEQVRQARDQAVGGVARALSAQTRQLDGLLKEARVAAALAGGDADAVTTLVRAGFPGAQDVQVLPADLAEGYAWPERFGYARLGLLEGAQAGGRALAQVVRDDGKPQLGVAAPARLAGSPVLVYVRLPLARLTGPLDAVALPSQAYLALRQGGYEVAQKGAQALAGGAESLARPVGETGLRVAAAIKEAEAGPFGTGTVSALVVAVLLVVLTGLVVALGHGRLQRLLRPGSASADIADEPTLLQALQALPAVSDEAAADRTGETVTASPRQVERGIFRAYDIRGVVGSELTPAVAALVGQAIGSVMQAQDLHEVVVGRDGRLSGPELSIGLIEGLRRAGCRVIDIGLAPTPVIYFAAHHLRVGSCVAVTGSHNPPDYNGFKVVIDGQTLSGEAIAELYRRIAEGRLHRAAEPGALEQRDVADDYIQRIADDVQLDRPLKVVADAGNGAAGEIAPRLLEAIGAEVVPLYCEIDGSFPNHHPDPSEPHNLEDLAQMVRRFDADLGVAFDGDADRLGVVTREGTMVFADRLLMLFAAEVLQRNPGALVIYDVKCTGKLSDFVLRNGGSPMMWKTGHSLIKAKMRETGAELAGEMSGHFFFKERWYGFDDGLYAAARLLEILAQREQPLTDVLAELPASVATPEIKVSVEGSPHALVERFIAAVGTEDAIPFAGARLSTIDGLRADFSDGWGLLRASNTTPVLVLRFEADSDAALARIQGLFRARLQALLPEAAATF
ncbi:MAG: phosphomannomutase/phosphoglucomutase [Pseudomonas sp.]